MAADVEPTVSDRGFKYMSPVPGERGPAYSSVRVYESSNAMAPCIWLLAVTRVDLNDPDSPDREAPVQLHLEDAVTLRDQLTYLIDNHYQT